MTAPSSASDDARLIEEVADVLRGLVAARPLDLAELFELSRVELRRVARRERRRAAAGETLSTTALINEAWLKLQRGRAPEINDRGHFIALAARAMRQLLAEYAREHAALKRGGGLQPETLDAAADSIGDGALDEALAVGDALDRLEAVRPRLAHVVYLRFYAGLENSEIGELLDVDESTVRRDWLKARGWLYKHLHDAPLDEQ